jgi:hypothetical protein
MYCFVVTNSTCIALLLLTQHVLSYSYYLNMDLFAHLNSTYIPFLPVPAQHILLCCSVLAQYVYLCCYINNKDCTSECQQRRYARVSSKSSIIIILLTSNPKCFLHRFRPSFNGSSTFHVQSILLTRRQGNCIWRLRCINVFTLLPTSRWMKVEVCKCFRFSR